MSTRTQRINILVTPEEKAAIEATASAYDLSVSEHLRQAALDYEVPRTEVEEVKFLVDEIGVVTDRLLEKMKANNQKTAEWMKEFKALRASHGLD